MFFAIPWGFEEKFLASRSSDLAPCNFYKPCRKLALPSKAAPVSFLRAFYKDGELRDADAVNDVGLHWTRHCLPASLRGILVSPDGDPNSVSCGTPSPQRNDRDVTSVSPRATG